MKLKDHLVNVWSFFGLFLALHIQQSDGIGRDIWIGSPSANWNDAKSNCEKCNGSLVQWDKDIRENLVREVSKNYSDQSFWIGNYSESDGSFSFEGCTDRNAENGRNTYKFPNEVSPILCKKLCQGHMYFAVKHDECICFDSKTIDYQQEEEPCPSGSYTVYSIGLLLRYTFDDDCRCNDTVMTHDSLWESEICPGTHEISGDNENKTCMVIKSDKRSMNELAFINFTVNSEKDPKCLTFMYYMNGSAIKDLVVYLLRNNNDSVLGYDPVWRVNGNHGNIWKKAQINIRNLDFVKIVIAGEVTPSILPDFESYMAIDNITVVNGQCLLNRDTEGFDCSFERDMCGWQVYNANSKWTHTSGLNGDTGPSGDRRSPSGYYLYAEADSGSSIATLYSPIISTKTPRDYCFRFWYFKYEHCVTNLTIFKTSNGTFTKLFEKKIESAQLEWKEASFDIKNSSLFLIKILATTQNSWGIAIDDISLSDGRCDGLTIIDCDFEKEDDLCGLKVDSNSSIKWKKNSATRRIYGLLPKKLNTNDGSRLISKVISKQKSSKFCLQFDYSSNFTVGIKIHISRIVDGNTNVTRTLFDDSTSGDANKTFNVLSTEDFQIIFELYIKNYFDSVGQISIYNITLSIGECTQETKNVCPTIHFSGQISHTLLDFCTSKKNPPMCEKENPSNVTGFYNYSSDCNRTLIRRIDSNTNTPSASGPTLSETTILALENRTVSTESGQQVNAAEEPQKFDMQIIVGILGTLCIVLIVVVLVLFIPLVKRRNKNEINKPTESIHMGYTYADDVLPQANRTFKSSGQQQSNKPNALVYDQASTSSKAYAGTKEREADQDQYIYHDLKESEYDAIGKERERRNGNKGLKDNIYDHTIQNRKNDSCNEYDAVLLSDRRPNVPVENEYSLAEN